MQYIKSNFKKWKKKKKKIDPNMATKNRENIESIKDRFLFGIKSVRVIMKLNITIIFLNNYN